MNIVRNSSPDDHKVASRAFQDIQNLRTFHAHNLLPSKQSDQYKMSQAKAWILQNAGPAREWDLCAVKLCTSLATALDIICNHWNRVTSSPEDSVTAVQALSDALEREWEPYLFDHIIEEAATALELPDFDAVKYRGARLDEWKKITEFFLDRSSAEAAIRRVIHQEMKIKFGVASVQRFS
ncbi:hypothetical protein [Agrobacterium tumefaciens]|uniref:hypothetical protein n=1 Tax=Agrobacterium tumefaciens TaxID=358 RepID=UPI003BA06C0A